MLYPVDETKRMLRWSTLHLFQPVADNVSNQSGRRPSCPTCRAKLTSNILIVPNYSLQHAIEKHVAAFGATGVVDWQPTGVRYLEHQRRQG